MEPKVVNQCLPWVWQYDEKRTFNNWAHGYIHYYDGREVSEKVLEMIQQEVQECDFFGGFHALKSVAQRLRIGFVHSRTYCRYVYPKSAFLKTIVWSFQ